MKTIAIRDVTGIMEPLPGFSVVRTDGSDGQRSIKLNGYKTTTNQYGYQFVKTKIQLFTMTKSTSLKHIEKERTGKASELRRRPFIASLTT